MTILDEWLSDQFQPQAHLHIVIHEQDAVQLMHRMEIGAFKDGAVLGHGSIAVRSRFIDRLRDPLLGRALEFDAVNGLLSVSEYTRGRDARGQP